MARIVFVGNFQAQALSVLFDRFFCDRQHDVSSWISSTVELSQQQRRVIDQADLLVEQVFDWQQKGHIDNAPTSVRRVRFPLVAQRCLWPFSGHAHIHNSPLHPELPDGPYPSEQGDTWLNQQIQAFVDPGVAVQSYLQMDVASIRDLDRIFEFDIAAQRSRDTAADIRMAPPIESAFRSERLFNSPCRPNLPLLKLLATAVFRSFSEDEAGIERMNRYLRVNPLSDDSLPIHPSVARHFGLEYGGADYLYPLQADGPFTFVEYCRRYMQYKFNHALARGLHLERTGATQKALADLQAGLDVAPNSVPGLLGLSRALTTLGRHDEAVEAARRALQVDPCNVRGYVQLGQIQYHQHAFDLSWESYQRALELDPDDIPARHLGSFTLHRLGRSADAAALLGGVLDADPMNADIHLHRGNLFVCAGDDAAAEGMYRRALEIGAPRVRTLTLLAEVLARQLRQDEALAVAREAVALAPGDSATIAALFRGMGIAAVPGDAPLVEPAPPASATPEPALFARSGDAGRVILFAPLMPPAQLPLMNEASMPAEIRDEHYEYSMPPAVAVYSLSGFRLCGIGLFRRGDEIFYKDDVLPPYLRPHLQPGGSRLPDVWTGSFYDSDAPVRRLDMPCFCPFHPNLVYGHFLLEMLPKLYLWHVLKECGDVYPVLVPTTLAPWARAFVDLLIDRNSLQFYDANREVVEAPSFVLASMMHTEHNFHPALNLAFEYVARAAGVPPVGADGTHLARRRLYVSRRRVSTGWHSIVNEDEIEALFAALGFEILHPQELSIQEQIRAFAQAEIVAGEYSSALHNTIFSPPGTRVIGLNRINWYQSRIGRLKRQPITYVAPADGVWRDWRAHKDRADFAMDCAQVRRVVLQVLESESLNAGFDAHDAQWADCPRTTTG